MREGHAEAGSASPPSSTPNWPSTCTRISSAASGRATARSGPPTRQMSSCTPSDRSSSRATVAVSRSRRRWATTISLTSTRSGLPRSRQMSPASRSWASTCSSSPRASAPARASAPSSRASARRGRSRCWVASPTARSASAAAPPASSAASRTQPAATTGMACPTGGEIRRASSARVAARAGSVPTSDTDSPASAPAWNCALPSLAASRAAWAKAIAAWVALPRASCTSPRSCQDTEALGASSEVHRSRAVSDSTSASSRRPSPSSASETLWRRMASPERWPVRSLNSSPRWRCWRASVQRPSSREREPRLFQVRSSVWRSPASSARARARS